MAGVRPASRRRIGARRWYKRPMRGRAGVLICLLIVGLVALWTYEPRLHHDFPSMVDDWSAIQNAPDQLRGVLGEACPRARGTAPGS